MIVVCSLSNLNLYEQSKLVDVYMETHTGQGFDSPRLQSTMIEKTLIALLLIVLCFPISVIIAQPFIVVCQMITHRDTKHDNVSEKKYR